MNYSKVINKSVNITSKQEENKLCVFCTKFPVKTSFILDTILYDIGKMVDHH
jgi:hypothetical protein